ncbi:MAG TPA: hypothetical protein VG478_14915 [Acidimicrobiales bacterium]|nr:hypothetical protein [Acidimicrobiales bacterium]
MILFDPSDRRRLLFAGVTSIAALPLLLGGGGPAASPASVAAIGPVGAAGAAVDGGAGNAASAHALVSSVDVDGESGPGFLIGPPPATKPNVVEVAVPGQTSANAKLTHASYRGELTGARRPCAIATIQIGMTIQVVNLHNGHTTTCTVVGAPAGGDRAPLVLDDNGFLELADLADQPIPVRISW